MWINLSKKKKGMKLDLGSGNPKEGEVQPDGYVLCDVTPHENIDLVCDIRDLDNFVDNSSCSVIRASHVLEHFTRKELSDILDMIHRLLERDGVFEIEVPNYVYFTQLLLEGKDELSIVHTYGGQLDEYDIHKNGFTVKTLSKTLREHGFIVKSMLEKASLACEAIKWTSK